MKFQLNTTEWLDWAENWCFRCERDHLFSHVNEDDGCELCARSILGEDLPEFEAHDPDWWRMVPAPISCSQFKLCTLCPPEPPDAERRGGLTRREFHDKLRAEVLAAPVVAA